MVRRWRLGAAFAILTTLDAGAQMQHAVAVVPAADATATSNGAPALETAGSLLVIGQSGTVTAKDHTALVTLGRGGEMHVCQSTKVQLTSSPDESLMVAVDRGALELRVMGKASDVVVTPDLRLTLGGPGPLVLDMRVTPNGDTCVENHGSKAPILRISDAFGSSTYEVQPGQHVLFERGNLREVVDRETTPCGCPTAIHSGSVADALLAGGNGENHPAARPSDTYPFPAAQSEGLEPAPAVVPAPGGQTHVQVASTLAYDPNAPKAAEPEGGAGDAGAGSSAANGTAAAASGTPKPAASPNGSTAATSGASAATPAGTNGALAPASRAAAVPSPTSTRAAAPVARTPPVSAPVASRVQTPAPKGAKGGQASGGQTAPARGPFQAIGRFFKRLFVR